MTAQLTEAEEALIARLRAISAVEMAILKCPQFMGVPDRWWEAHERRCVNDHVSTRVLKSEELGRDACLAGQCRERVFLTFPEDADGPIEARLGAWIDLVCEAARAARP